MAKFEYDSKSDILYVFKEGEKSRFSIEFFENFIVDVGENGKVVGLEILNASKELKLAKKELEKVDAAEIATVLNNKFYGVNYTIHFNKVTLESELRIPQVAATHTGLKR
ncbi:MAG: DUF2283 domain-containing protein [Candidatus Aenigmatarchaeota archaeon]